jgi:hypothetical protein
MIVSGCPRETPCDTHDHIVDGEMVDVTVSKESSPYARDESVRYVDEHVEYIGGISMFSRSLPTSVQVARFAPAIVRRSTPAPAPAVLPTHAIGPQWRLLPIGA